MRHPECSRPALRCAAAGFNLQIEGYITCKITKLLASDWVFFVASAKHIERLRPRCPERLIDNRNGHRQGTVLAVLLS